MMPIKNLQLIFILMVCGISMAGCRQSTVADEIDTKVAGIHAASTPPPAVRHLDMVVKKTHYQAKNNPFVSPFYVANSERQTDLKTQAQSANTSAELVGNQMPKTTQNQRQENAVVAEVVFGKKVLVNPNRSRQMLEKHLLSSLKYQGRIEQDGRLTALLIGPDKVAYPVHIGQYVGQNHGKIIHIDREKITVAEAALQADGQYYERLVQLKFVGNE